MREFKEFSMSFPKAAQKISVPPEVEFEYKQALLKYSMACRDFKQLSRYKTSADPMRRLAYYEGKDRFSFACRQFNIAKGSYQIAMIDARLKAVGVDTEANTVDADAVTIAQLMRLGTPASMQHFIKENKKKMIAESISDQQFEKIKKAALEYQTPEPDVMRVKDQWEDQKTQLEDDPTVGFDPLPE